MALFVKLLHILPVTPNKYQKFKATKPEQLWRLTFDSQRRVNFVDNQAVRDTINLARKDVRAEWKIDHLDNGQLSIYR